MRHETLSGGDERAFVAEARAEGVDQPRLAEPRFAGDDDELALTGARALERGGELRERGGAAGQIGRRAARRSASRACTSPTIR